MPTVTKIQFISDMLYVIWSGHWCDTTALNAHAAAAAEDKSDSTKNIFYEELQHVLADITKYHMNILFTASNTKVGREGNSQQKTGTKSLHNIYNMSIRGFQQ